MFLEKKDPLHDCLVSNYVFESLHPPQLRHAGLLFSSMLLLAQLTFQIVSETMWANQSIEVTEGKCVCACVRVFVCVCISISISLSSLYSSLSLSIFP